MILTDSSINQNREEFFNEFEKTIKEISKIKTLNIAIIGINLDYESKKGFTKVLTGFNKSCYLDHDKLEDIRLYMAKTGVVQMETNFMFEKYNK